MGSTLNFTVVKSIQTALLVLPSTVLLGWGVGIEEATLVFDGFEVVSLFATTIPAEPGHRKGPEHLVSCECDRQLLFKHSPGASASAPVT